MRAYARPGLFAVLSLFEAAITFFIRRSGGLYRPRGWSRPIKAFSAPPDRHQPDRFLCPDRIDRDPGDEKSCFGTEELGLPASRRLRRRIRRHGRAAAGIRLRRRRSPVFSGRDDPSDTPSRRPWPRMPFRFLCFWWSKSGCERALISKMNKKSPLAPAGRRQGKAGFPLIALFLSSRSRERGGVPSEWGNHCASAARAGTPTE